MRPLPACFPHALFLACLTAAPPLAAHHCRVVPPSVKLGETLRITCPPEFTRARLRSAETELFLQPDGQRFGLLPVAVTETPGKAELKALAGGGAAVETLPVMIRRTVFPSQNVKLSPEVEALHSTPEELAVLKAFKETISASRSWRDPLAPPVSGCMTSPFGVKRLHNGKPTGEYHGGVDQRTPEGEPIRAVAAGTVVFARAFNVLGYAVGLNHGQGLESMYLHMSSLAVAEGSPVERGDALGYAGSTGRSTGPHLHWVLYVNGVNVNPAQWMKLPTCTTKAKR